MENKCLKCKNQHTDKCDTCFQYTKCGTVFDHTMEVLKSVESTDMETQFAALFHDVGKTKVTQQFIDGKVRFINHEIYGAKKAKNILKDLKFDNQFVEDVCFLINHHMDIHHLEGVSKKSYRKFVREIPENLISKLFDLVDADRKGTIVLNKDTYQFEQIPSSIEQRQIVDQTIIELKKANEKPFRYLNGQQIMELLNIKPGKEVGRAIEIMLDIQDEYGQELDIDQVKNMIKMRFFEPHE